MNIEIDDSITIDQETLNDLITLARAQFTITDDNDQFQYAHTLWWGISRFVVFIEKAARLYRLLGHDSLVELLRRSQVTAYQLDAVIRLLSCWDRESLFRARPKREQTDAEELLARLRGVLETHGVMKMEYEGAVYHADLFPWGTFQASKEVYQPVDGRAYNTTRDLVAADRATFDISSNDEEDHATDSGAVGA